MIRRMIITAALVAVPGISVAQPAQQPQPASVQAMQGQVPAADTSKAKAKKPARRTAAHKKASARPAAKPKGQMGHDTTKAKP